MSDAVRRHQILAAMLALMAPCGCSPAKIPASVPGQRAENPSGPSAEREAETREAAARRLATVAASGRGDPIAEATRAASTGDFRFVGYSMLVPGLFPAAYGVICRPSVVSQDRRLVGPVFGASDVMGSAEEMAKERATAENFDRFGKRYNAALLADRRYPYHDLCRAGSSDSRELRAERLPPHRYGFRDLVPTDRPIDPGEAARRGTAASLDRLIASKRAELDKADILGMTPLGWAVAYRRGAAIEALLGAGASPAGAGRVSDPTAPIQIARAMQWRAAVEAMLKRAPALREAVEDPPRLIERSRAGLNAALAATVKGREARLAPGPSTVYKLTVTVNPEGQAASCRIAPLTGADGLDRALCGAALRETRWKPGRGAFGEAVAGVGSLTARLEPRRQP
ncbi:hypothetical protein FHS95_000027 [Sphingomonas naasensis]|uniref:Uncharacterized protein n=1 Tax=Sphingomonas naasensis TaxID=1344951 RepID=A0A4S1WTY0_9SPHN|nr:hypothetical protein [Sphingomonas naasensis]NIJ18358.1 hypothetical protein [Sphingomonas naasensis]TGX45630.1 hypothetical protein E5A74_00145 [Sphingomonas naasensis]